MNHNNISSTNILLKEEFDFISNLLLNFDTIDDLNSKIEQLSGIKGFFRNKDEFFEFNNYLNNPEYFNFDDKQRDQGDYQTPPSLTDKICSYLLSVGCSPKIVIEPTYGRGTFITSSMDFFPNVKSIYAVEIQKKYEWFFKLSILKRIAKGKKSNATINLYLNNIFTHVFPNQFINSNDEILIIGNPPWVTNSELSSLASNNIPNKSNFKELNGLDAITGKGNFDIAEYIILKMLETFSEFNGTVAFICKNIVIRNILRDLPKRQFKIYDIKSLGIDAKKEFNASCDASVFIAKFGKTPKNYECKMSLLESPDKIIQNFGWINMKFVSDIDKYSSHKHLDGNSPLEWRSGIKHDCSKVLDLKIDNSHLINGFGEELQIENDLLYPLLKSSDIKGFEISLSKRMMIVTQKKVGEDTSYIANEFPKIWDYLRSKSQYFNNRKSSIYKNKPLFSIFGVGNYSFMPYKVAISGMYKKPTFALIQPICNKSVMCDDTCYFLGFESYNNALFTCSILNSRIIQDLLESLVFLDSKRVYTKDLLMRIDLIEAIKQLTFTDLTETWKLTNFQHSDKYCESDYNEYKNWLNSINNTN